MPVIELNDVNKYFGTGSARVHVLHNLTFSAEKGQLVLILGPSGSGKSTFLTIAGSLQTPTSGTVKINGEAVHDLTGRQQDQLRLNKIGFVLQAYNLVPYLTVKDQFKLVGRVKQNNISGQELADLLDKLGLTDLVNKYPKQLSGGQRQRVAIARALYTDPEIILADEPTAALDSQKVEEVGQLLADLAHEKDKAVIVVTHDLRLRAFADKIYQLEDGRLRLEKDKVEEG